MPWGAGFRGRITGDTWERAVRMRQFMLDGRVDAINLDGGVGPVVALSRGHLHHSRLQ